MKQYTVSNYYNGIFISGMVMMLPAFYFAYDSLQIYAESFERSELLMAIFLLAVAAVGFFGSVYKLFFDMPSKFAFDSECFYLKIGWRTRKYCWDDIKDCGIVKVRTGNDKYTYWVFFAKRVLTQKERINFLRKTRFERDNMAYFEYTKKSPIDELKAVLPVEICSKLANDERIFQLPEKL